jgi:aspartate/methionine/tyrosine aminotransferase
MGDMTEIRLAERMGRLGTESAFEVLARAKALEAAGKTVIHLEIGEPDFPTADHISRAAIDALLAGQTHYVPAPGIPALREAVAAFLDRTGRLRGVSPDRVVVTPGAKPIMFFTILALAGPGDEVLYPDPGFPMYESITACARAAARGQRLQDRRRRTRLADHAAVQAADTQLAAQPVRVGADARGLRGHRGAGDQARPRGAFRRGLLGAAVFGRARVGA